MHGDCQTIGVRLDLTVGDHPALLAGAHDQIAFVRAGGQAGQQRDTRGAAIERVPAALVKGQLVGNLGGDDHRDGHLLVSLGDQQRHRGA